MKTLVVCPDLYNNPSRIGQIAKRLDVHNIITVPKDKHYEGWTNLFFVNPETLISTTAAYEINSQLRTIGFNVIEIPFDGILRGEGAPRCCTAPILRDD
jgi:N-dimethylarginine dimethylaminohydrolase